MWFVQRSSKWQPCSCTMWFLHAVVSCPLSEHFHFSVRRICQSWKLLLVMSGVWFSQIQLQGTTSCVLCLSQTNLAYWNAQILVMTWIITPPQNKMPRPRSALTVTVSRWAMGCPLHLSQLSRTQVPLLQSFCNSSLEAITTYDNDTGPP